MEHIEEAGIHSGDSACSLPPYSLNAATLAELDRQTRELAMALKVVGLMNVQFAIKDGDRLRARGEPARFPHRAVRRQGHRQTDRRDRRRGDGRQARSPTSASKPPTYKHVAVKEAVFPFARFPGVDPMLGPEMRSTGEVMGIDSDFAMAFVKSQLGSGQVLPMHGTVFISVKDSDKDRVVAPVRELEGDGLQDHRHPRHQAAPRGQRHRSVKLSTRFSRGARTSSTP